MAGESRTDRRRLERGLGAIVFLGLFAYAWKGIGSHLLYHGFGVFSAYPVFSWDSSFLQTVFTTPGGVMRALAALLAQTYQDPLPGALVIVAVLSTVAMGTRRRLHALQADKLRDLAWIPPLLALMIYNRYDNPLLPLLALAMSVWMANLRDWIPARTSAARLGVFLALFTLTYHAAGGSAFVFAGIVCLTEALLHRRPIVAVIEAALACGGAYVAGRLVFGLGPRAIYTIGTPWDPAQGSEFSPLSGLLLAVLYAFVPGLILVVFFGRILATRGTKARSGRRGKAARPVKDARQTSRWKADGRLGPALRLLVVGTTALLSLALSRSHIRYERALHYWTQQRDWDRAIGLAHRMRGRHAFTASAVFDINRALAHQGRLGEELCAYPQDEVKTLFLSFDGMAGRFQHAKLLELYLDLGCPNAAEKNAYELMDNEGPSPHVLEALVRIHLAKEQYESARIAFRALQKYAGGRGYVDRWQEIVADPARAENDPCIQSWRRVRGTADYAVGGIAFEPMLKRLLLERPENRLAFEYLMANYLLKHQRAEFVSCLPLLRPLGYKQLPRQYGEAILVHSLETRTAADPQGWTIAPEVYDLFRETMSVVQGARGNNQAVFDTLAARHGDSYTFYSMFNVCGAK